MNEGKAALLGALIGGFASLVGAVIAGTFASRAETRRFDRQERVDQADRIIGQAAEVFQLLFSLQTCTQSAAWFAGNLPRKVDDKYVEMYEERVQQIWPRLYGASAVLAGMSGPIYGRLLPWIERIRDLDAQVATHLHQPESERNLVEVGKLYPELRRMHDLLLGDLGSILTQMRKDIGD